MSGPIGVIVCAPPQTEGQLVRAINESEEFSVTRRCADLTEVRACARSSVAQCAIVDADDPDLDARVIEDLHSFRIGVIVLAALADAPALRALGADGIAQPDSPDGVLESLRALRADSSQAPLDVSTFAAQIDPAEAGEQQANGERRQYPFEFEREEGTRSDHFRHQVRHQAHYEEGGEPSAQGRVICVWGPSGAPGRSTVAFNVAAAVSARARVLLVDADTCAPSIAHMAGLGFDASGVSVLSRAAARSEIGSDDIRRAVVPVADGLDVLTGISAPQRWREISPAALVRVLAAARSLYDVVIVDVAAASLDPVAPGVRHQGSRDDVVAAIVRDADSVLCVFRGDSLGINRLVDAYQWLTQTAPGCEPVLVANHVSRSGAGPRPVNAIVQALAPVIPGRSIQLVPEDSRVCASLLHARAVVDAEPAEPVAQALAALAAVVVPVRGGREGFQ